MQPDTASASQSTRSSAALLLEVALQPMKSAFVGKDEIIDLIGVCLVGRENLFLHGPPGTAKSALIQDLARRIDGRVFDYLLTRFTEPNELFGPFDIRKLREGELVTNTEGMLPEAALVFLDELLNANSAILNSLLLVLNERVFRRGRETRALPLVMVVGASNHLPEDEALGALFDRFLVRVPCCNVPQEELSHVLHAGWNLDAPLSQPASPGISIDVIRQLQAAVRTIDVTAIRPAYVDLIQRLRHAGIAISDRRAVKFQRLIAASALLCDRQIAEPSDLWPLRYTWDTVEQQEVLAALVKDAMERHASASTGRVHPRSAGIDKPDVEALARDLDRIAGRLGEKELPAAERSVLRDQLSILAGRCPWVSDAQQQGFLQGRIDEIWKLFAEPA
ncbi:MAG: ravA 2 [Planctomycetaceae bacterium]|nr:ravA 2 [Planctomycetaceae bacterium]